jgi:hypothetical protein
MMPKKHLAVFKKYDGDLSDAVKKVSFSKPDERSDKRYAREVITRFATRAFRTEQPSPAYVDQFVERYAVQRANGLSPRDALIERWRLCLRRRVFSTWSSMVS